MASVAQILRSKASQTVWSISASASVYEAIVEMARRKVGALIVTHDGHVSGIVTERDYARKIVLLDRSSRNTAVRDIMTTDVHHIDLDQTTEECMALMTAHRIRYLPVMIAGQLIGMVSIGDLIQNLIVEQEQTIQELEHYIHGNGFSVARTGLQAQRVASLTSYNYYNQ